MKDYVKVLTLMNDNADGAIGAFSIQNVARMSLIFNKFPGEFHGPGSISNVMRDLNKMYLPYTNFQIVHFQDGMVYLDKIQKAGCQKPRKWLYELIRKDFDGFEQQDKGVRITQMHLLFKKYVLKQNFGSETTYEYENQKQALFGYDENESQAGLEPQEVDDNFFDSHIKRPKDTEAPESLSNKKDYVVQDW